MSEDIFHAPETVAKSSITVVLAGTLLVLAIAILLLSRWILSKIKNEDVENTSSFTSSADTVTVREVSERYKTLWTPGHFWPRNAFLHTTKTTKPYFIYKAVWMVLTGLLICCGFYLIFAGFVLEIEVFREIDQLSASAFVSAAICLCAVWPFIFRIGSTSTETCTYSREKASALWVSFFVLLLASICAVRGSALLQAWTLPGPQFGTLMFLGPGYGIFAGWVIFAASLNLSVAIDYANYPSGTLPYPNATSGEIKYTYKDSLLPSIVAIVILSVSCYALDPSMPFPMLIAVLFFTPRHLGHLIACGICLLGILVSSWLVVSERVY